MSGIIYRIDPEYCGEGISAGLPRGLLADLNGTNLAQEGMGLGTIAVKMDGYTYFAGSCSIDPSQPDSFRMMFSVDRRLVWQFRGKPRMLLTRWIEKATEGYMRYPQSQNLLLKIGTFLRKALNLTPSFEVVPALLHAFVHYRIEGTTAEISLSMANKRKGRCLVYLLNELGADYFTASLHQGRSGGPPSGWELLARDTRAPLPALYDPEHGLIFRLVPPDDFPGRIFWGREKTADYCWAGFEMEIEWDAPTGKLFQIRYQIQLESKETS